MLDDWSLDSFFQNFITKRRAPMAGFQDPLGAKWVSGLFGHPLTNPLPEFSVGLHIAFPFLEGFDALRRGFCAA